MMAVDDSNRPTDRKARTMILRNVPDLHIALTELARNVQWLDCESTGATRVRWIPCATCPNVVGTFYAPVHGTPVSIMCDECVAPCTDATCGLLVHQHHGACEDR